jgi:hypothetical protein
MSYCRWSSDDFRCDVYCYCDGSGWRIYVAGRRHVPVEPLPDPAPEGDTDAWVERMVRVSQMIQDATLVDIGGPLDGESYHEPTPGDAADRLEEIRAAGYIVPQYAIDELRAEAAADTGERAYTEDDFARDLAQGIRDIAGTNIASDPHE